MLGVNTIEKTMWPDESVCTGTMTIGSTYQWQPGHVGSGGLDGTPRTCTPGALESFVHTQDMKGLAASFEIFGVRM